MAKIGQTSFHETRQRHRPLRRSSGCLGVKARIPLGPENYFSQEAGYMTVTSILSLKCQKCDYPLDPPAGPYMTLGPRFISRIALKPAAMNLFRLLANGAGLIPSPRQISAVLSASRINAAIISVLQRVRRFFSDGVLDMCPFSLFNSYF